MKLTHQTAFKSMLRLIPALLVMLTTSSAFAQAPSFSASFSPSTIAPGNTSKLTFTIQNTSGSPIRGLNFSNTLPAGAVIAPAPGLTTTCVGASLTGTAGGSTFSLTDGGIAPGTTCTVSVNVVGTSLGTSTNNSGDLTSDAGNSGTASSDLTVANDRPGLSMSISPSTIRFTERSTLTFTFDNSANASGLGRLNFRNVLPAGLVVASPANASTDCGEANASKVISAVPGSSVVSLDVNGINFNGFRALNAGQTCSFTVDVVGVNSGVFENVTDDLGYDVGTAGFATGVITVTPPSVLSVTKSFVNDPAVAGGTVDIEYTVSNRDRRNAATNITFTDDLGSALAGFAASGLPQSDVCGAGSSLSGTSVMSLTNGTLGAGESCTFTVTANIPAGAAPGSYPGITSTISANIDGSPVTGDNASDILFVNTAPTISRTFQTTTVAVGDTVTAEYTITNTNLSSSATAVSFVENLANVIPGITAVNLPAAGFCGAGSTLNFQSFNPPPPGDAVVTLTLSGGTLLPGESCVFTVDFVIPTDAPAGTIQFDTGPISATIDGTIVSGGSATGSLDIVGGLLVQKTFDDSALIPGGTVDLQYTIALDEGAPAGATNLSFTDDLGSVIPGLVAVGLPQSDVCGVGSALSGTDTISFSGGSLSPGEICTFVVRVQVPANSPFGSFVSTASNLTGDISGVSLSIPGASDTLDVISLGISHRFVGSPYVAGEDAVIEYTLTNNDTTTAASGILFTHNLGSTLGGLIPNDLPKSDVCGTGSQLINSGAFIIFQGGALNPGESCTFTVNAPIPAGAAAGSYTSTTSSLVSTARLDIVEPLTLTKTFIDDPVAPGSSILLQYSLTNLDTNSSITGISFTDDLDGALSGLAATGLPHNDICGVGSSLSGTGLITFSSGTLAPGASCSFSVSLDVPASAPKGAIVTSATSQATGTVEGLAVTSDPAEDDLEISAIEFSKSFDGGSNPGGAPVLTYTIENLGIAAVDRLGFTDNLDDVIPGLVAVGLPQNDVCGVGSALSGTSLVEFTGGLLGAGETCSFSVTLQVPANAATGTFESISSSLRSDGVALGLPASASLSINPTPDFAKAFSSSPVLVGQSSTLTFTIDNSGSLADATAIDFTDTLPAGMTVAAAPNASTTCAGGTLTAVAGSGTISYTGGTVPAGSTCTVTVDVTANAEGSLVNTSGDLTSSLGNSGSASATLVAISQVDIVVSATESADPVIAGSGSGNLTYVISATNNGPSVATGVELTSALTTPAGVSVDSITPSIGSVSGSVWSLGSLAPNAGGTLTIVFTVDGTAAAGVDAIAATSSLTAVGETLVNTGDDSATIATSIETAVDLVVGVTESIDPVVAGSGSGNLTYVVSATNNGPSNATGVALTTALTTPSRVTVDSITPSVGSVSGSVWTLGDLAPNAGGTLTIVFTVDGTAAGGVDVIAATSSVSAVGETLINTGDDSASVATTIEAAVDLVLAVSESIDPVVGGSGPGNLTYLVTVTNQGPAGATGAVISNVLVLPSGVSVDSVTPSAGSFSGSSWNLGSLAANANATLSVVLTVDGSAAAGTDVISNTASVATVDQQLVNTGDDSASEATSILQNVDLALAVSESADPFVVCPDNPTGSHTVTVTNDGPGSATGVVIDVNPTLPAGVTISGFTPSGSTSLSGSSWTIGSLASGASETLLIEFELAETTVGGLDSVSTSASVSAVAESDSDSGNDQASVATSVVSSLNLTVAPLTTKPVKGMGIFTHEVQVTNDNPVPISGARLYVASLPSDAIVLNADDIVLVGDPAAALDYVLINGSLASGASETVTVKYLRTGNQSPFTPGYNASLIKESEVAVRVETASPYPFKIGSKTFSHPLTVTNLGSVPVSSFRLYVGNLPSNVDLQGLTGNDDYGIPPVNLPYILVGESLAAGESKTIDVIYKRSNNNNHFVPDYRTRVTNEVPALPDEASIGGVDSAKDVSVETAMTAFPQTGNLLEWEVTPGKSYQVQYSETLDDWQSDPEILTATGNRLQWFDGGQVTGENPRELRSRYYRLKERAASAEELFSVADEYAESDPEAAAAWILSHGGEDFMTDEDIRDRAVQAYAEWLRLNPEEAAEAFGEASREWERRGRNN